MSLTAWIIIVIMIVGNIAYDQLRKRAILNRKTSEEVINFPVHEFNEEELNAVRGEIEAFFVEACENRRCELSLTARQLNCICSPRVEIKGFFFNYAFENNKLIQRNLIYPDIYNSEGYEIKTWTTEFAGSMTSSEYSSLNGSPLGDSFHPSNLPVHELNFWMYLFSGFDRIKVSRLAKKLTIVEIIDDKLILKI